jgi:dipeptidyl aminopeptidase/acylaminoacyl peptidase
VFPKLLVVVTGLSVVLLVNAEAGVDGQPASAKPAAAVAVARHVPTIDELVSLATIGSASISPDGRHVAYLRSAADLDADAFVAQVWMADTTTHRTVQMTRGSASASDLRWSPDSQWLSFISNRHEKIAQVFAMRPDGGEALRLTDSPTDVTAHAWSPDGRTIAFTAGDDDEDGKKRGKTYGDYQVIHREYHFVHLWTLAAADAREKPLKGTRLTRGHDWSVDSFDWSPDGRHLAFAATRTPDLIDGNSADVYIVDVDGGAVRPLVTQPGPDSAPRWSPDGQSIVFTTTMGDALSFHANQRLAVVPAAGGTPRSLTDAFDESASPVAWRRDGIYFTGLVHTASHLFRVDPATSTITRVSSPDNLVVSGATLTRDGSRTAFVSTAADRVPEVFVAEVRGFAAHPLTDDTAQTREWLLGTREVVSWKSQDGEIIEGVLIKPADYDPARRYPLLCVIHGGPTGVDRPTRVDGRYYPVDLWVARGALVLKVNYRGSAGYGQRFRRLNVGNLGVGDAWDVLSGVDALIAQGHVDPDKLACMGWSQGGYISAFLTTSSTRFKAISVGAGISDWATYYYNTDITPFTRQYLGADPAADPAIYRKTSPMTYIAQAQTPTLIQHGELDRRVPIANGYELRQGLEDRGVPVEMVVYKGFGHGITKPKAMRAVMDHNLRWFNHYLFGDAAPDLTRPALPAAAPVSTETKP